MSKIVPFFILIGTLVILSGAARTGSRTQALSNDVLSSNPDFPSPNAFSLKEYYPLHFAGKEMLASIYTAKHGQREKEILSIWSKESFGYELQYIKIASAGHRFTKPQFDSSSALINIFVKDTSSGSVSRYAALKLTNSSLQEISSAN